MTFVRKNDSFILEELCPFLNFEVYPRLNTFIPFEMLDQKALQDFNVI